MKPVKLKVLLPDGSVKRFPPDAKRNVEEGNLTILGADGERLAAFAKGSWTAVGRMRIASEPTDDE